MIKIIKIIIQKLNWFIRLIEGPDERRLRSRNCGGTDAVRADGAQRLGGPVQLDPP